MRRLICYMLALLLCFSSCASGVQEDKESAGRLIVTYQTMPNSRLDGLKRIETAVNRIAKEATGTEIELLTVDAVESFSIYPMWLSQGKQIDLMVLNYQDIQSYIKNRQLMALDDLLEDYGGGIQALMDVGCDLTYGTMLDSSIYGLSLPRDSIGSGGGLWIPLRYLEEVDFPFEEDRVYTLDEVEGLFAKLKQIYPDKYPMGKLVASGAASAYNYLNGMSNPFGDGGSSGSLNVETGRVENFFATDVYYDFLARMRRWYELGYIYPDAAYTGFSNDELLINGEILSIPLVSQPGMYSSDTLGEAMVCLRLSQIYLTGGSSTGTFWVIPSTCNDSKGAMRFLNLMYTDERVVNLLSWGEENSDYLFLDKENGVIAYPVGVTEENADYYNPLGLYGDMRRAYVLGSDELKKQRERYAAQAVHIGQEYEGFFFDESSVSTEAWQVRQTLYRYLPVLESGCVELDTNYAEFLADLEEAGINTVIEEKQRQLDVWLSNP